MAGSYRHLLPLDGDGFGWSMIEHMGDAHECVEELFWLVESQIGREKAMAALRRYHEMKSGALPKDQYLVFVERQMSR